MKLTKLNPQSQNSIGKVMQKSKATKSAKITSFKDLMGVAKWEKVYALLLENDETLKIIRSQDKGEIALLIYKLHAEYCPEDKEELTDQEVLSIAEHDFKTTMHKKTIVRAQEKSLGKRFTFLPKNSDLK